MGVTEPTDGNLPSGAYADARGTFFTVDPKGVWRGTYGDPIAPSLIPRPIAALSVVPSAPTEDDREAPTDRLLLDTYNVAWSQEWNRLDPEMKQTTLKPSEREKCRLAALRAVAALGSSSPVETVTTVNTAAELPVGSVFIGYYFPRDYSLRPVPREQRVLASMQFTRGERVVYSENASYGLDQPWERIEVLFRPSSEETGQ